MSNDLHLRIRRIYAAVDAAVTPSAAFGKLAPCVHRSGPHISVLQDFAGGKSDAELANILHTAIGLVAGLRDILLEKFDGTESTQSAIRQCFSSSPSLETLRHLWNTDKHGTGRPKPCRIDGIKAVCRLRLEGASKSITMTLRKDGTPVVFGDGTANVIVSGDIHYQGEARVDDAYDVLMSGVSDIERLLSQLGFAI